MATIAGKFLHADTAVESKRLREGRAYFGETTDERIVVRAPVAVFYRKLETEACDQWIVWNASGAWGEGATEQEAIYYFLANLYTRAHLDAIIDAHKKP